jgi:hypothetical protein
MSDPESKAAPVSKGDGAIGRTLRRSLLVIAAALAVGTLVWLAQRPDAPAVLERPPLQGPATPGEP